MACKKSVSAHSTVSQLTRRFEMRSEKFSSSNGISESVQFPTKRRSPMAKYCEICEESKGLYNMFNLKSCSHSFCNDCINKHVAEKVQNNVYEVKCPAVACGSAIEFDSCMSILSKNVKDKWDELLCKSFILDSQKFYCPYKDCSALLERDTDEVIREAECPVCWRLFCAECNAPWHSEIGCEEFRKQNEGEREREDFMLRELAKQKEWNRCPRCKFYVEKTSGCIHITCRCGFQSCYRCGETWTSTHGSCQRPP